MANVGAHASKAKLDWVLGGATPTRPDSRLAALLVGIPSSVSILTEWQPNSGYARQTALFGAAASPQMSASNTAAMTFGPFSSSNIVQGLVISDTISINSGNIWWYGTLLTTRTVLPGDQLIIAAGALIITLS